MNSKEDQNENGLTFLDWCRAAAWPEITLLKARTEWIGGVDPSDYRAEVRNTRLASISRDTRKKGLTNTDM